MLVIVGKYNLQLYIWTREINKNNQKLSQTSEEVFKIKDDNVWKTPTTPGDVRWQTGLRHFSIPPIAGRLKRERKKTNFLSLPECWPCLALRVYSLHFHFQSEHKISYHWSAVCTHQAPITPVWAACISFLQFFYKEINSVADAFRNSFCKNVNKSKSSYCGGERRDEVPGGATAPSTN